MTVDETPGGMDPDAAFSMAIAEPNADRYQRSPIPTSPEHDPRPPGAAHGIHHESLSADDPAVVPEVESRQWGRATDQFLNHPFWTTAGALVGIVGLTLSAFQIWQAAESPAEDLTVSMTSIGGPQPMSAERIMGPTKEVIDKAAAKANPIDITLQNDGGEPSLITEVIADVTYFERLGDCTDTGAGPIRISADYSLKLPAGIGDMAKGQVKQNVRFEVKPHAVDRMSLTVGPDSESADYFPNVMGVHLTLKHDNGKALDAGTYALVTNYPAIQANIDKSSNSVCAEKNLAKLDAAQRVGAVRSTEMDELRTSYQALAG